MFRSVLSSLRNSIVLSRPQTPMSSNDSVTTPADVHTVSPETIVWIYKKDLGYFYGFSGPFQWNAFYFVLLVFFVSSLHMSLSGAFTPDMDYWCAKPPDANMSDEQWKSVGIPTDTYGSPSKCLIKLANGSEVPCESWVYNRGRYTRSLRDEFDLVCDREWLIALIKIVFDAGALTSDLSMGRAADSYGRYPVIYVNVFIAVGAGLATLFIHKFSNFLACRFFVGFGLESIYNTGIVLLAEVADSKDRCIVIMAGFMVWVTGQLALWPIITFLDNWLAIQLIIMAPTMLLVIGLMTIVESPRFLLAVQNYEDAGLVIMYAAAKNHVNLDWARIKWKATLEDLCKAARVSPAYQGGATLMMDRKNPKLLKTMATLGATWFVTASIYISMDVFAEKEDSGTMQMLAEGMTRFLVEVVAFFLAVFIINRSGRCLSMSYGLILGGLVSLFGVAANLAIVIPYFSMAVLALGRVFVIAANNILHVATIEILPTVARNRGFNACTFCGHIGNLIAFLSSKLENVTSSVHWFLVLSSVCCVINSVLVLRLPETKDRDLPDDFDDIEDVLGPFQKRERVSESRRISEEFRKQQLMGVTGGPQHDTPAASATSSKWHLFNDQRLTLCDTTPISPSSVLTRLEQRNRQWRTPSNWRGGASSVPTPRSGHRSQGRALVDSKVIPPSAASQDSQERNSLQHTARISKRAKMAASLTLSTSPN